MVCWLHFLHCCCSAENCFVVSEAAWAAVVEVAVVVVVAEAKDQHFVEAFLEPVVVARDPS